MSPKITLEQWLCFQAVADEGSYARAAKKLHKSQSTISYNVQQLQHRLGFEVFTLQGRKAVLTNMGQHILNRSRRLTAMASGLEASFQELNQGVEQSLALMVDGIFPRSCLYSALVNFEALEMRTILHIYEGILSGTTESLMTNSCEIAISTKTPEGTIGIKLLDVVSKPYAHQDSPLHQIDRPLTMDDLYDDRYIIVMDSGKIAKRNEGWLGSEYQWKVDSMYLKSELMSQGIGFSWLPEHMVKENHLPLKPLRFEEDVSRTYSVYLIHKEHHNLGQAAMALIRCLRNASKCWT